MVLFNTIGPVSENKLTRPGVVRTSRTASQETSAPKDAVIISDDAREAARSASPPAKEPDTGLRLDLIERARENIRNGVYKKTDIIGEVAATITQNI
jgi:anti-sigma28 factor (negative regulator of flagellin synthesis)